MSRIQQNPNLDDQRRIAQLEKKVEALHRMLTTLFTVNDNNGLRRIILDGPGGAITITDGNGAVRIIIGNQGDGTYDVKKY